MPPVSFFAGGVMTVPVGARLPGSFTTGTLLTSLKVGDYWGSCDHVRGDADEKLGPRFAANAQKALCRKLEMCGAPEALGTTCNGGVWAMPFG